MSDAGTNSYSQWSDLPNELLDMILSKMSIICILNFRAVCPSWRNAAKSHVSSLPYPPTHRAPWLMLSPILVGETDFRFFSLEDEKVIKRVTRPHDMNRPMKFYNSLCLGSSHGWLVMLDENVVPYLFDPFHLSQIQLPFLDTVEVFKFPISDDGGIDIVPYYGPSESLLRIDSVHDFRELFYSNAVISADPYHNSQFYVVMLASFSNKGRQLMFHRGGDIEVWMLLGDIDDQYCDIVCHGDKFYALNFPDRIDVWDTNVYTPERDYEIDTTLPEKAREIAHSMPTFGTFRAYLVESCGDLLLVVRYVGEYVDDLGRTTRGEDSYKTLLFLLFKLDYSRGEWVEMESLGDQVLFLGGVQSTSFSASDIPYCQPNSIYFADDYWGRIREHTMRYDTGVFDMEDKSIRSFYECELGSEPPPFWVDPKILLDSRFWNAENYRQQV